MGRKHMLPKDKRSIKTYNTILLRNDRPFWGYNQAQRSVASRIIILKKLRSGAKSFNSYQEFDMLIGAAKIGLRDQIRAMYPRDSVELNPANR